MDDMLDLAGDLAQALINNRMNRYYKEFIALPGMADGERIQVTVQRVRPVAWDIDKITVSGVPEYEPA